MRNRLVHIGLWLALGTGAPAGAVIIASGDGTGNTTAPPGEPGFANVGRVNTLSGVYLGNGWMITADHNGLGDTTFAGVTHRAVPGSAFQLSTGQTGADLELFRLETDPGLPALTIAGSPPSGEVILVGKGQNRGAATQWDPGPGPPIDGWQFCCGTTIRWGTNLPEGSLTIGTGNRVTDVFQTSFTENGGTTHESQVVNGDSGGGAFYDGELTGVIVAAATYEGQPSNLVLFGQLSFVAELASYRTQILNVIAVPACDNGVDDDGDGAVDGDDPGCDDASDPFERSDALPCDDGLDNDGDGAHDSPGDIGCIDPMAPTEAPACSDGIDNDSDGKFDFDGGAWANGGTPLGDPDPQCTSPTGVREKQASCGLGFELAPLLVGVARRRRRARGSRGARRAD